MKDDYIDALRYSIGLNPVWRGNRMDWFDRAVQEAARQKEKTMLDTSKKYKVGSVVYKLHFPGAGVWRDEVHQYGIIDPVMQQLYDDGLAVEVKEPFEKTWIVEFNHHGNGKSHCLPCLFDLVRHSVGRNAIDTASVANRTFDVTIKERL